MRGKIEAASKGVLRGWIWDPAQPTVRISAEVVIDGALVGTVVAERRRADLVKAGIGDGGHAFDLPLPAALCDGRKHVVVLRGFRDGSSIAADTRTLLIEQLNPTVSGKVEGIRRNSLIGWAWDRAQPGLRIEIDFLAKDKVVASTIADRARGDLVKSGIGDGKHGFEMPLASLPVADLSVPDLTVLARYSAGEAVIGKVHLVDGAARVTKAAVTKQSFEAKPAAELPKAETKPAAEPARSEAEAAATPAAAKSTKVPEAATPAAPLNLKDTLNLAAAAESAGKLAEARDLLDTVLAAKPKDVDALFRRARVALALSDVVGAKVFAMRACEIKKDHPKALVTLARVADLEKQWALSLEYWSRVPRSESAFRERLLKSARLLVTLERPLEAMPLLKEAVALKPEDAAARKTLMQLALDTGDLACALEQYEAMEALGGAPSKTPPALKPQTHSSSAVRRHKGALAQAENPVVLAVGNALSDLLLAKRYAGALTAHFGTPIDLLVPEVNPAVRFFFEGSPEVRRLLSAAECSLTYEVAFILPEFSLLVEQESPAASLRYVFAETHTLSGGTAAARHRAYSAWLTELTGISAATISRVDIQLSRGDKADKVGQVVLVSGGAQQNWAGYPDLAKLLKGMKRKVAIFDLTASTDAVFSEMAQMLSGASAVVCNDEAVAGLADAMGVPVLFVTAANAGVSVRTLASHANLLRSAEACTCAETTETRWKAVVGACDCVGKIAPATVLQALKPLLPATAPAKLASAVEPSLEMVQ